MDRGELDLNREDEAYKELLKKASLLIDGHFDNPTFFSYEQKVTQCEPIPNQPDYNLITAVINDRGTSSAIEDIGFFILGNDGTLLTETPDLISAKEKSLNIKLDKSKEMLPGPVARATVHRSVDSGSFGSVDYNNKSYKVSYAFTDSGTLLIRSKLAREGQETIIPVTDRDVMNVEDRSEHEYSVSEDTEEITEELNFDLQKLYLHHKRTIRRPGTKDVVRDLSASLVEVKESGS